MRRTPRRLAAAAAAAVVALTGAAPAGAQGGDPAVDDPGLRRQWAIERIGAPAAWRVATGEGVTIAVVDSGIDVDHPDLVDKIDGAADCVGHDDVPSGCVAGSAGDDAGHGTHVAGIAAASTDNGIGVAGVAPRARLLAVRVLSDRCGPDEVEDGCEAEGTEDDVADGIRWAADNGADVINLSLGSVTQAVAGPGDAFEAALEHAWAAGAIPVLVAGNDLLLPGSLLDVPAVVVTATNRDDRRASYSNGVGNVRWGVAAPGGESDTSSTCEASTPNGILSTFSRPSAPGRPAVAGYACVAGTSMAAPHVAGALAVLRSAGLDPDEAVERLLATAEDLGSPGVDTTFGSGRIDLAAAVAGLAPTGQPVGATGAAGPTGTDVSGTTAVAPDVAGPTTTPAAPTGVDGTAPTTAAPPPPGTATPGTDGAGDTTTATTGSTPLDERAVGLPGTRSAEDLPDGPLTLAVLFVVAVLGGHAWRYLGTASWARRTPDR